MAALRHQQAYDHRVRLKVFQGERDITHSQQESIPRSTISTWKARPPKQVVTLACAPMTSAEMERDSLLIENQRLKTKLAAMRSLAMLLWTVLRFSGFTFEAQRLPSGADKKRLLRAIKRAGEFYRLSSLLSRIGLSSSRYHAWGSMKPCELTDVSSCPRSYPSQASTDEQAAIGKLLQDPDYSHVPTSTLVVLAQRLQSVFLSATTWYRPMRLHGWRRPRKRVHP